MREILSGKCVAAIGLLIASTGVASAQGPCFDSPENSTLILGLLGAVSAGLPWLRARRQSRRPDPSQSTERSA